MLHNVTSSVISNHYNEGTQFNRLTILVVIYSILSIARLVTNYLTNLQ